MGPSESRAFRRSIMMLSITRDRWPAQGYGELLWAQATHCGNTSREEGRTHWLFQSMQAHKPCGTHQPTEASPRPSERCLFHTNPDFEDLGLLGVPLRLSHLGGILVPGYRASVSSSSSKVPLLPSHSTRVQRKVEPLAKYAKKEGRPFSLRKTQTGREPVLPVLTKMSSEIMWTSDLSGLWWKRVLF